MKESILLVLALLCLADSVLLTARSNLTLGLVAMYLLTAALFAYWRFFRQVDAFCARGAGFVLKLLFFAGLAFFVVLCVLMGLGARPTATFQEKAVIVLGAGLHGDDISDTLRRRLDAALIYHDQNPKAVIVVSGGQGPQENRTEAAAMAEYLTDRGVPVSQIILEDRSVSTRTNFTYSYALLEKVGVTAEDPVCFITNEFHCYRAAAYAARAGFLTVHCYSTGTSPWFLPAAAMREALAICALWATAPGGVTVSTH